MKLHEILNESPFVIPDLSVQELNTINGNTKLYHDIVSEFKSFKIINTLADNLLLIYSFNGHNGVYAVIYDDKKSPPYVCYVSKFTVATNPLLGGQYATQTYVWISPTFKPHFPDIAMDIVFHKYVSTYGVLATDNQHTPKGIKFWKNILSYAFSNNLNVYFVDTLNNMIIKIDSMGDLKQKDEQYNIWSNVDIKSGYKLVCVSNKPL